MTTENKGGGGGSGVVIDLDLELLKSARETVAVLAEIRDILKESTGECTTELKVHYASGSGGRIPEHVTVGSDGKPLAKPKAITPSKEI